MKNSKIQKLNILSPRRHSVKENKLRILRDGARKIILDSLYYTGTEDNVGRGTYRVTVTSPKLPVIIFIGYTAVTRLCFSASALRTIRLSVRVKRVCYLTWPKVVSLFWPKVISFTWPACVCDCCTATYFVWSRWCSQFLLILTRFRSSDRNGKESSLF
jgi:hypothetical protein